MAKSNITLKLLDGIKSISTKALKAIISHLNKAFVGVSAPISEDLKKEARDWLNNEQVIRDLRGSGSLNAEVGLPKGQGTSAADSIVEAVIESLDVKFKKFDTNLSGGLSIGIQPEDFQNILGIGQATIVTEKGQQLDWLQWLLEAGNRIIIRDYEIKYGSYGPRSRSGQGAIMVKTGAKGWKMPSQYSGTAENNFITRAFEGREDDIARIVSKRVKSKI
tara:strand:+ start:416 stop:1075 length:660 start_codon:yes stop_codon:yes gene_type:complete